MTVNPPGGRGIRSLISRNGIGCDRGSITFSRAFGAAFFAVAFCGFL